MAIDFEKLQDSPHLLDILIQMEDVLDQMDIYVFDNWLKGEVVEGPIVRRYWLDMTLRYPFRSMPDPKGALRLLKHDVRVDYRKASAKTDSFEDSIDEEMDGDEAKQKDDDKNKVWLVRVSMPRRLVVQIDAASHDIYDDEVDVDDVEDAKDSGMDDETEFHTDEQDVGGESAGDLGPPPGGPPGGPGGGPGGPPGPGPGGVL